MITKQFMRIDESRRRTNTAEFKRAVLMSLITERDPLVFRRLYVLGTTNGGKRENDRPPTRRWLSNYYGECDD